MDAHCDTLSDIIEYMSTIENFKHEIRVLLDLHTSIEAYGMSPALSAFVDRSGGLTQLFGEEFGDLSPEAACEGLLSSVKEAFIKFIEMVKDFFAKLHAFLFRTTKDSEASTDRIVKTVKRMTKLPDVSTVPLKTKVPSVETAQLYGDLASEASRAYTKVFEHFRDSDPITFLDEPIRQLYENFRHKIKCGRSRAQKKQDVYFFKIDDPIMEEGQTLDTSGWGSLISNPAEYKRMEKSNKEQLRAVQARSGLFVNVMQATKLRLDELEPKQAKLLMGDMQACTKHFNKLLSPSVKIALALKSMKEEVEGILRAHNSNSGAESFSMT